LSIYWAMLLERSVDNEVVANVMDIAGVCAVAGYIRIPMSYTRTDQARNNIVDVFLKHSRGDDDVLVMLDNDHMMPRDVVVRLASQVDATHEIVGALAFRRSLPHDPCFFIRSPDGNGFDVTTHFTNGLMQCMCVGTGAIAIRKSALLKLQVAGTKRLFFRYSYNEASEVQRSEDFEFGVLCEKAGIPHWVDTSFYIPHQTRKYVGPEDFYAVLKEANDEPDKTNARYARIGLRFSRDDSGDGASAQHVEAVNA